MKSIVRLFCLALALCCLPLAGGASAAPAAHRATILVSIDGFRADYFDRGVTPAIAALAKDGARAERMRPSFPSLTFPNHYTLVTGLRPDHHGIVNNTMQDPTIPDVTFKLSNKAAVTDRRWWDDAEPIWVTAEKQGVRAGTMFWPGSEADIGGVRPSEWRPYDKSVSAEARVDTVLGWLDEPADRRPGFITLYFDKVDTAGHDHGPDSAEVNEALAATDTAIARLVEGLKARGLYDQIDLVIVADHGMLPVSPERLAYLDEWPHADAVHVVTMEAVAGLVPLPGREKEAEALVGKHPHAECWRKAELPAALHYGTHRRIPPIVCLADPTWMIETHEAVARHKKPLLGEHGYDPADPGVGALFVAHGPDFRTGVVLQPFDNVDVYPLLAELIGVKPRPNDGHIEDLRPALKPR